MRQEQSHECFEHHMLLKGELTKISNFLFGCPEKGDEISFVSKVALMFDTLTLIKRMIIGSALTILGAAIFVGQQLKQIEVNSRALNAHLEQAHEMEKRITKLETAYVNSPDKYVEKVNTTE